MSFQKYFYPAVHSEKENVHIPDKVQRADLTCDVLKKLAPFVLSKL